MEIKDAIVNFDKYDSGAIHATQGFEFQCHWSISKLLELYKGGNDFTMLLDHIDDVVVFENNNGQEYFEFFQIKKKDKKWSIKDLTRKKDTEKNSIISKMANNYYEFESYEENIRGIFFISNQNFTFNPRLIGIVNCSDLTIQEVEELSSCVKSHCMKSDTTKVINLLRFQETDLEPKNAVDVSKAKIADFFNNMPFPVSVSLVTPFYTTLVEEVNRKIRNQPQRNDFETLSNVKGITRSRFDDYVLNVTDPKINLDLKIFRATESISSSNIPIGFRQHFNIFSKKYWLENQNKSNHQLTKITERIDNIIDNLTSSEKDVTVYECVQIIFDKFENKIHANQFFIDKAYLKVIIFIEVHGKF